MQLNIDRTSLAYFRGETVKSFEEPKALVTMEERFRYGTAAAIRVTERWMDYASYAGFEEGVSQFAAENSSEETESDIDDSSTSHTGDASTSRKHRFEDHDMQVGGRPKKSARHNESGRAGAPSGSMGRISLPMMPQLRSTDLHS